MSALAIIQARLGSSRLPRKVLARFAGRTVIDHVWSRVRVACVHTVVAVPAADRDLITECHEIGAHTFVYDGDPEDVLGRFRACAAAAGAPDILVRITADCPFVQPQHIAACVLLARAHEFAAVGPRSGWPDGLDVEAFSADVLATFSHREHVTAGVLPRVTIHSETDLTRHRWTLDTSQDLRWFRHIAEHVNCEPPFHPTVDELLKGISRDPQRHGHYATDVSPDIQQGAYRRSPQRRRRSIRV